MVELRRQAWRAAAHTQQPPWLLELCLAFVVVGGNRRRAALSVPRGGRGYGHSRTIGLGMVKWSCQLNEKGGCTQGQGHAPTWHEEDHR